MEIIPKRARARAQRGGWELRSQDVSPPSCMGRAQHPPACWSPSPSPEPGFFWGEGGRRGFCLLAFLGSLAGLMRTLLIFTTLHSWLGSAVGLAAVGSSSGAESGDFWGASGSARTARLPPVSSGSGTSPLTPWGFLLLVCPASSPVCPSGILLAAVSAFGSGAWRPFKPPKSQGAAHSPRAARDAGGARETWGAQGDGHASAPRSPAAPGAVPLRNLVSGSGVCSGIPAEELPSGGVTHGGFFFAGVSPFQPGTAAASQDLCEGKGSAECRHRAPLRSHPSLGRARKPPPRMLPEMWRCPCSTPQPRVTTPRGETLTPWALLGRGLPRQEVLERKGSSLVPAQAPQQPWLRLHPAA